MRPYNHAARLNHLLPLCQALKWLPHIQGGDSPAGLRAGPEGRLGREGMGSKVREMRSLLVAGSSGVTGKANYEWASDVREGLLKRRTPELPRKVQGAIQQRWWKGNPGRGNRMCKGRKLA